MKKYTFIILLLSFTKLAVSQTWKAGIGVQTLSQPLAGIFIEADHNKTQSNKFETLTRLSIGYRNQTSAHKSLNVEVHRGYRLKIGGSYYVEQTLGFGAMYSFYSDQYWYEDEWYNLIYTGNNSRTLDVTPSASVGLGRYFGGNQGNLNHVWIRPKAFLQLPANNPSNVNFTLQIGYSRSLSK